MTALTNWNDVNTLNVGDEINFADKKQFKIVSKDIDRDPGGIRVVFTLNNNRELIINHRGDVSGDLGEFNLSDNKLKRVVSGGKRRSRRSRTHRKRSNKRKGRKSTRRHRRHK
jgi:hypothetical protein